MLVCLFLLYSLFRYIIIIILFLENNYEKAKFARDNLLFKIEDPVQLGSGGSCGGTSNGEWEQRFWNHYYPTTTTMTTLQQTNMIDKMVKEYLIGIKWIGTVYNFSLVFVVICVVL